jgi:ornithine carbamoyltransferase
LLERAEYIKKARREGIEYKPLKDKVLAMIFEKPSTRTRVSFEVGMYELGGTAINMGANETQISRGEPVKDTARVLSRYVHAIMIRTYGQEVVDGFARWSSIPVINGLSDSYHPCQILSDLFTIKELKGSLDKIKIAYVGDGNNVANSWIEAAILLGLNLAIATPHGFEPDKMLIDKAKGQSRFSFSHNPSEAVRDADIINTDVWVSMGQEKENKERRQAFKPYRVDDTLLAKAKEGVVVMHCLPAHRTEEITDEVFERFAKEIFTQAENRLHVQKALLEWLIGGKGAV